MRRQPCIKEKKNVTSVFLSVFLPECHLPGSGVSDTSPFRAGKGRWMGLTLGRGGAAPGQNEDCVSSKAGSCSSEQADCRRAEIRFQ